MKVAPPTNGRRRVKSASPTRPAATRVAAYTRQSVDRSTGQEFGSIQAQRQAIAAYVESHTSLGWTLLPEHYDDAGFSGGNTRRPAFERIMHDAQAGTLDIIAVYKVDRFSRSLPDFAQTMRTLERLGVAFLSITQNFDTSTAIGRLTMNLLGSFAEFERQMVAERTRDKLAAVRRQGMWGTGRPPMGYSLRKGRLVIKKAEAALVRSIFELYGQCDSLSAVAAELNRRGARTRAGKPWDKKKVRRILNTVTLTGKVPLDGEVYDGRHQAIIDPETFEAVQVRLRSKGRRRSGQVSNKWGRLLKGLLYCARCASPMVHHYSTRKNRRYHYYLCQRRTVRFAESEGCARTRAKDLEEFVVDKIRDIGRNPTILTKTIDAAREDALRKRPVLQDEVRRVQGEIQRLSHQRDNLIDAIAEAGSGAAALGQRLGEIDEQITQLEMRRGEVQAELAAIEHTRIDEDEVREALAQFDPIWDQLETTERTRVLHLLIERIEVDSEAGRVDITYRPGGIEALRGSE